MSTEYLSRFHEPGITAYEFLKGFFAHLKKLGMDRIDRDLVVFLHEQKKNESFAAVFEEIAFRSNGVSYSSDDIEDALFNLQNGGLLGKTNPSFGVILINQEIEETLDSIPEKYKTVVEKIANTYKESR